MFSTNILSAGVNLHCAIKPEVTALVFAVSSEKNLPFSYTLYNKYTGYSEDPNHNQMKLKKMTKRLNLKHEISLIQHFQLGTPLKTSYYDKVWVSHPFELYCFVSYRIGCAKQILFLIDLMWEMMSVSFLNILQQELHIHLRRLGMQYLIMADYSVKPLSNPTYIERESFARVNKVSD